MWPSGTDSGVHVGTVSGLWRFPVKSMAGEALPDAEIGWTGVAGDRKWAFGLVLGESGRWRSGRAGSAPWVRCVSRSL